jgi:O-antigen/teichoic acid export membrane protein
LSNIISRVKRGAAAQVFTHFTNITIQVTTVPLLLHFWGLHVYGEWLVLSALPSYLSMGDLGFVAATCNDMAILVAKGDRQTARRVFQTTSFLVAVVASIGVLLTAALARSTSMIRWLDLGYISRSDAELLLPLFSAYVVLVVATNVLYAGFFCQGNYGHGTFLTAAIRLLEFLLLAFAVYLGARPLAAASALAAGRLLGNIVMYARLRGASPWLGSGVGWPDLTVIRRLLPSATAFSLFPLGNALNLQGIIIAVNASLGGLAVAGFSTLRTLTRFPVQIVNSINGVVQPEMARAFGNADAPLIRRIHRLSFRVSLWVSFTAAVGLSIFGGLILRVWTHGRVPMDRQLFTVLLGASAVNMLWQASLMTAYATNRHRGLSALYALVNAAVVGGAFASGKLYGARGIGILLLLGEQVMALNVIPYALKLTSDRAATFVTAIVHPPLRLLGARAPSIN